MDRNLDAGTSDAEVCRVVFLSREAALGPPWGITIVVKRFNPIPFSTLRVSIYLEEKIKRVSYIIQAKIE